MRNLEFNKNIKNKQKKQLTTNLYFQENAIFEKFKPIPSLRFILLFSSFFHKNPAQLPHPPLGLQHPTSSTGDTTVDTLVTHVTGAGLYVDT